MGKDKDKKKKDTKDKKKKKKHGKKSEALTPSNTQPSQHPPKRATRNKFNPISLGLRSRLSSKKGY
jgi:hypothetical protein